MAQVAPPDPGQRPQPLRSHPPALQWPSQGCGSAPQPAHRYGLLPLAATVRLQRRSLLPRCALLATLYGLEEALVTTLVPWYCCVELVELAPRATSSTPRLLQAAPAPSILYLPYICPYLPISAHISLYLLMSQAALASALCAAACRLGRAATRAILAACTR